MNSLVCGRCGANVGNNIDGLRVHLNFRHGTLVTFNLGFRCGQEGCERVFIAFKSLKRHILKQHAHLVNIHTVDDEDEDIANEDEDITNNDDVVGGHEADDREGGSSDEEQLPELEHNVESALSLMAAHTVLKLRSNSAVTASVLSEVFDCLSSCFDTLKGHLESEIKSVLQMSNVDAETSRALVKVFNVENPFNNLDTVSQQMSCVKQCMGFVDAIQIPLGQRIDQVKVGDEYLPKLVNNTFQYVPFLSVIELILSNDAVREAVFREEDSENGILAKYRDGQHFKNHLLYSEETHALQFQIYYDDLEVANPLGSKRGVHKLGAFYFRILNMPPHLNSSLASIHLLMLAYAEDFNRYSLEPIFQPFLEDLKKLEDGVIFVFGDSEYFVKGTVASVCGDGLAVHQLYGLLGPQCRHFCRLCMISRADLLAGDTSIAEERTRDLYEQQLERLTNDPFNQNVRTETGLKDKCVLHKSRYFHFTTNYVFDAMHDLLEGVSAYEIKLVLHHYVFEARLFDVPTLNGRIHSYDYGVVEVRNKPSANFTVDSLRDLNDHSLKQKAAQTWLLTRVLPFLFSDFVAADDDHMRLISLLNSIMNIVFAPRIHVGTVPLLETLLSEHHALFKELFPDAHFINKHHHLRHYPRFITEMGPPVLHWCMRYEAKHHELSRHGAVCCNFKNLPKTMARLCQISQAKSWGSPGTRVSDEVRSSGGRQRQVAALPCGDALVAGFELDLTDYVFVPRVATWRGNEFRRNLFVVLSLGLQTVENYPVFGKIVDIAIIHGSAIVLVVEIWETGWYDEALNAYEVHQRPAPETSLVLTSDLADHRPVAAWNSFRDNHVYVCPKTCFL